MQSTKLSLTLLKESDWNEVLIMFQEPGMFQYITPHRDKSVNYYLDFLNLKLEQIKSGTGFYWLVRDKNGELAGTINLTPIPDTGEMQIGWMIRSKFRGQGLAYDAAKLALEFGFRETNFDPIYGVFEVENIASEKILKKLGFMFYEQFFEGNIMVKQYIYKRKD